MRLVCLLALALLAAVPAAARPACGRGRRTVVILPAPRPIFVEPRWGDECRHHHHRRHRHRHHDCDHRRGYRFIP